MPRTLTGRLAALTSVVVITLSTAGAALAGENVHQSSPVNWHAQQAGSGNVGLVADASASLVRNENGITFKLHTNSLEPGDAYTLWFVVVNDPSECSASPCTAADILQDVDTRSQVRYGTGGVAGGSGKGTFAGHVSVGPLAGWLDGRALEDPFAAEIHLVLNSHGPKIPAFMPDMIKTYRGGCSDASPFPGIFPPSALADGAVGPNICRLYQAAIFLSD